MGLLDTFAIIFRTNADEAAKGVQQLDKQLNDTEKHLSDTEESTKKLGLSFVDLAAAAVSAWGAVSVFNSIRNEAKGVFDYNLAIEKMTRLTGENADSLKAWDGLVQQAGGSADEFSQWISKTAAEFQAAGLGDRIKNIIPSLKEFSGEIQNVDMQTALTMGHLRGIPDDLVLALKAGPDAVDALLRKIGDLNGKSEEGSKAAREFAKEWQLSLKAIGGAWTDVEDIVLPFLTQLLHFLNTPLKIPDWLAAGIPNFFLKPINDGSPNSAAPSGANAEESRKYWASRGYTPEQVAGLLANEQRESGFNAGAVGDNGSARGIFQWHADRRAAILAATGIDVSTAGHADQLKAADWELEHRGDADRLRGATTAEDSASIVSKYFERPGSGDHEAMIRSQLAVAQMHLNAADNSGLNSASVSSNNSRSLSIGTLNINTQATDAHGIAGAIGNALAHEYQTLISSVDTGRDR